MTWEIFIGIAALFSFGVAVVTPIIRLNTSITKLNSTVEYLNKTLDRHEQEIAAIRDEIQKGGHK